VNGVFKNSFIHPCRSVIRERKTADSAIGAKMFICIHQLFPAIYTSRVLDKPNAFPAILTETHFTVYPKFFSARLAVSGKDNVKNIVKYIFH
jgi:hypothetical protein